MHPCLAPLVAQTGIEPACVLLPFHRFRRARGYWVRNRTYILSMSKCAFPSCTNNTTGKNVCCSRTCSNKFFPRRKKETHQCIRCKKQFPGKGKCLECKQQISEIKEKFQNSTLAELNVLYIANGVHRSWWYSELRADARKKGSFKECAVCGYDKHVETCHIKAISAFETSSTIREINDRSNLMGLCPNHHWEFDHGLLVLPPGVEPGPGR